MWYTIGAARERHRKVGESREDEKKLEKSLKNLLTNERQSGIINKL